MSDLIEATVSEQLMAACGNTAEAKAAVEEIERLNAKYDSSEIKWMNIVSGLQLRVEKLEGLYLRGVGSCEPLHLAAAIGNRPCVICGEDGWVVAATEQEGE